MSLAIKHKKMHNFNLSLILSIFEGVKYEWLSILDPQTLPLNTC
jgi:hypothetical protein